MLKSRIIKWNRERGLLEKFDVQLELRMLSEELREFYLAETLEHRLAEYSDFIFVFEGTKAKFSCRQYYQHMTSQWEEQNKAFIALEEWAIDSINRMYSLLSEACRCFDAAFLDHPAPNNCHLGLLDECLDECLDVIIVSNERKGSDKIDGKVVKAAFPVNPVVEIERIVRARLAALRSTL